MVKKFMDFVEENGEEKMRRRRERRRRRRKDKTDLQKSILLSFMH